MGHKNLNFSKTKPSRSLWFSTKYPSHTTAILLLFFAPCLLIHEEEETEYRGVLSSTVSRQAWQGHVFIPTADGINPGVWVVIWCHNMDDSETPGNGPVWGLWPCLYLQELWAVLLTPTGLWGPRGQGPSLIFLPIVSLYLTQCLPTVHAQLIPGEWMLLSEWRPGNFHGVQRKLWIIEARAALGGPGPM